MEVDNLDIITGGGGGGGGGSGGGGSGSRWNPTKEQIDMLEGLYRQGLRTPSADQINQITNRLRVFGHIEGKNVFYWFQNHKARQRQKLKQDNINYYSRLLHKTSSVFPPPACPNVVCSPFYFPYHPADHHHLGGILYHQQQQQQQHPNNNNKVLLPRPPLKRKSNSLTEQQIMVEEPHKTCNNNGTNTSTLNHQELDILEYSRNSDDHQTLDLFPLKPSGNLHYSKTSTETSFQNDGSAAAAAAAGTNPLTSPGSATSDHQQQQRLFDFFRQNGH